MRAKLDRIADALDADGIVVEHGRRGGKSGDRMLTLNLGERVAEQEQQDEPVSLDDTFDAEDEDEAADDVVVDTDDLDVADDLPERTVSHDPASKRLDASTADDLTVRLPSSTPCGEYTNEDMGRGLGETPLTSSYPKEREQPSDRQPAPHPGEFGCEVADDLSRQPSANRQSIAQPSAGPDPEQAAGEAAPSTEPHLRLVVDNDLSAEFGPDDDEWADVEAMAARSD